MDDVVKEPISDSQIVELCEQGLSFSEIGRICGISRQAVHQRCRLKLGLETHRRYRGTCNRRFSEADIRRLHASGYTDARMAEQLGVSKSCVSYWRRMFGLPRNRRFPDREMFRLYSLGYNDRQIAEELGVAPNCVWDRRKRLGLAANRYVKRHGARSFTDEAMLELYFRGYSDRLISEALGVGKDGVRDRRRRLELPPHDGLQKFTDEELSKLHARGYRDAEISQALGVCKDSVQKRRSKLGLPANNPRMRKICDEELRQLHSVGYNDPEIAERLGVGRSAVIRKRERLGLPANGRKRMTSDG